MILLIDHRDSFTYNLYQYFLELHQVTKVVEASKLSSLSLHNYEAAILSPGPGTPSEAIHSLQFLKENYQTLPILGICLGHQIIAHFFGGKVIKAPQPVHGKTSFITHHSSALFQDIPSPYSVTRYHSLCVSRETIPDCLRVTAETSTGIVMALEHRHLPIMSVQFHPEAILSEHGHILLNNFLKITKREVLK